MDFGYVGRALRRACIQVRRNRSDLDAEKKLISLLGEVADNYKTLRKEKFNFNYHGLPARVYIRGGQSMIYNLGPLEVSLYQNEMRIQYSIPGGTLVHDSKDKKINPRLKRRAVKISIELLEDISRRQGIMIDVAERSFLSGEGLPGKLPDATSEDDVQAAIKRLKP